MMLRCLSSALAAAALTAPALAQSASDSIADLVETVVNAESVPGVDARFNTLSDDDYRQVADELGVDVAAIKAVVRIEAGKNLEGFWAPGVPVANYSQTLFNKYKAKGSGRKISDAKVPEGLSGFALREWSSLVNARKKNADAADMATYWGMFQICGAYFKLCGCNSVEEFVEKMSDSEHSQLELFAQFIKNAGMLESLRNKDWKSFARKYNGPSYAKRGYHTRLAKEYAKFKALAEKEADQ